MKRLKRMALGAWNLLGDERFGLVVAGLGFAAALLDLSNGHFWMFAGGAVLSAVVLATNWHFLNLKLRPRNEVQL